MSANWRTEAVSRLMLSDITLELAYLFQKGIQAMVTSVLIRKTWRVCVSYDVRKLLDSRWYEDNNASPCPKVREILGQRIEENLHQIEVLMEKQERMENAMVLWDSMPDKNCGSGSICHLIEAVPEKTSGA